MNKNFKIVQLSGLSGLLILTLVMVGIFCGFVLFPIWGLMTGWNSILADTIKVPSINYIQAALLWGVIALSLYQLLKNNISLKIQHGEELTDIEIKQMISENTQKCEEEEHEKVEK